MSSGNPCDAAPTGGNGHARTMQHPVAMVARGKLDEL
jgi:hypothetical protein